MRGPSLVELVGDDNCATSTLLLYEYLPNSVYGQHINARRVCMYDHHILARAKSNRVRLPNPARGQLNRGNEYPVPVRA